MPYWVPGGKAYPGARGESVPQAKGHEPRRKPPQVRRRQTGNTYVHIYIWMLPSSQSPQKPTAQLNIQWWIWLVPLGARPNRQLPEAPHNMHIQTWMLLLQQGGHRHVHIHLRMLPTP